MDDVAMAMLSSTTLYDDQPLFCKFDGGREFTHVSSVVKTAKYSVLGSWTQMPAYTSLATLTANTLCGMIGGVDFVAEWSCVDY